MISFRYHLVTIVAVFLALALGVLAGTTVIKSGSREDAAATTDAGRTQLANAQDQADPTSATSATRLLRLGYVPPAARGATVVVRDRRPRRPLRRPERRRRALRRRGVIVVTLTVTSLLMSGGRGERAGGAAGHVARHAAGDARVRGLDPAGRPAGARRAVTPPTTAHRARSPDLLGRLIQQGFVTSPDVNPGDASEVGGPDQLMVVSAGGQASPAFPCDVHEAARRPAGRGRDHHRRRRDRREPSCTRSSRSSGATLTLSRDRLLTIDDVELPDGRLALRARAVPDAHRGAGRRLRAEARSRRAASRRRRDRPRHARDASSAGRRRRRRRTRPTGSADGRRAPLHRRRGRGDRRRRRVLRRHGRRGRGGGRPGGAFGSGTRGKGAALAAAFDAALRRTPTSSCSPTATSRRRPSAWMPCSRRRGAGRADLAVAAPPRPASAAGSAWSGGMAARLIRRASGLETRAPLSGQRAADRRVPAGLPAARRGFGVDAAMVADAARLEFRVVELPAEFDSPVHRTRRRRVPAPGRGRARDIFRALVPRAVGWR